MIRSRSLGPRAGRRRLASSSVSAETRNALALLTAQPLPDHDADGDQRARREEPGDQPFRDRAEVADRPAALVVRMLGPLHVADDRVDVVRRELPRGEA